MSNLWKGYEKPMEKDAKSKTKSCKMPVKAGNIPAWLAQLDFDDYAGWAAAHKKAAAPLVARAALAAYRRRNFLSVAACAKRLGFSQTAILGWESGKNKMQWSSRVDLVRSGEFKPEHFGGSGSAADVGYIGEEE